MADTPGKRGGGDAAWPVLLGLGVAHAVTAFWFLGNEAPGTGAAGSDLPLDDGWIHLVYARALAAGEGFAYNPGVAEAGATSPLWAILLAPLFWLRLPWDVGLVPVVKVVGTIAAWVASVLAYRWVRALGYAKWAAIAAGVALALDPWFTFAKVSGMEVPLAGALILAALLALTTRRDLAAGLALAAALLTRPECALLVAAVAIMLWRERRLVEGPGPSTSRDPLRVLGPAVVAAIAWSFYCLFVTGRPLPATFYAKHAAMPFAAHFADAGELGLFVLTTAPLYACAIGAFVLVRSGEPARRPLHVLAAALAPAWILGVFWAHHFAERDAFYWVRYLLPIWPLVFALGAIAVAALATRSRRARPLAVLAAVALLFPLIQLPALAERYAWNCQNVREMNVAAAQWLAARTRPDEWIASYDAGAVRFVADRPTVDLVGLNTHLVLDGGLPAVIAQTSPRWWVVFPPARDRLVASGRFTVAHTLRPRRYTICRQCPQRELIVLERAQ